MTKQQLLALLREAYMIGWSNSLIDEDMSSLFLGRVERTNRVGDLEFPVLCEWIKIIDRRPEQNKDVLVTDGKYMAVAYLEGYSYFRPANVDVNYDMSDIDLDFEGSVTHWMPLPQPPEEV